MLEINCMRKPPLKKTVRFRIVKTYEVVVGGEDCEDIVDSVTEFYNDHLDDIDTILKPEDVVNMELDGVSIDR